MDAYGIGSLTLLNLSPTKTLTASANETGVDVKDFIGTAAVILDAAAGTGTTPTDAIKLQSSPDNATWTDVAGGAFTGLTTVASQQRLNVNIDANDRYLRVVDTIAGTTPSYTRSVNLVGRKQVFP